MIDHSPHSTPDQLIPDGSRLQDTKPQVPRPDSGRR